MMRAIILAALAFATPAVAADKLEETFEALSTVPMSTKMARPVAVRVAMHIVDLKSFDDNSGTFEATADMRLTWDNPDLAYPIAEGLNGYKEWRASKAEVEIAKLWTPPMRIGNREGLPTFVERRLRIYPDGTVETITRTTAKYKTPIDVNKFPFDRQRLEFDIRVREETTNAVTLEHIQNDLDFSRPAKTVDLDGWDLGLMTLDRAIIKGWNGDRYSKITAALGVQRIPTSVVPVIFIPLFASLLIPLLVLWMNGIEDGEFKVDAFELANVMIGGLFSVIALGFTVSSTYTAVASGDNTVTRLFALNYCALAISLLVIILLYRFSIVQHLFNRYFQEEVFKAATWAVPVLTFATATAFVLVAAM